MKINIKLNTYLFYNNNIYFRTLLLTIFENVKLLQDDKYISCLHYIVMITAVHFT